mgnify:CR=1 FL=1
MNKEGKRIDSIKYILLFPILIFLEIIGLDVLRDND